MPPTWIQSNLELHTTKRLREIGKCFIPYDGENLECLTPVRLKNQSIKTYRSFCLKFVAEHKITEELDKIKHKNASHFPPRRYYIDSALMISIVSLDSNKNEENFITCFHKHFGGNCPRNIPAMQLSPGSRIIKFRNYIRKRQEDDCYRNVIWE